MIKDSIKNANKYYNLSKRIELGLKYLKDTDFSKIKSGKYEILGSEVYALVQEYLSKPKSEGKFEAHKKYIDIQYIIEGEELMGVSDISNFSDLTPYNQEKDIVFLSLNTGINPEFISVRENEFAIFTEKDAHMPSIAFNTPELVKKVVVKVLI